MARTAAKNLKPSSKLSKPKPKPLETTKTVPVVETAPTFTAVQADDESGESEDGDSEDEGVDQEGMDKLMRLLGEDGLDDIAEHQLGELGLGDDGSEEESEEEGDSEDDSEDEDEEVEGADDGDDASDSGWVDEDEEMEASASKVAPPTKSNITQAVESDEDGEDDEAVPLDEVSDVEEDIVPKQKIVINNELALKRIRETIELGKDMPWSETLAFTNSAPLEIPNADDDLNRELAFYKQALETVTTARSKFAAAKLPFSRPSDYFAEMVKSDSHMERIRQRLLDERAGIQKSEAAKKQRELKKVGKQVQVEKLKEREKGKKEMNERVKGLKRKRGGALDAQDSEAFDVAVEEAIADRPAKRGKPNMARSKRDAKFGFGGAGTKGRRGKQNTKESTESFDFKGGMGRDKAKRGPGGKGGKRPAPKRPGKSRRHGGGK